MSSKSLNKVGAKIKKIITKKVKKTVTSYQLLGTVVVITIIIISTKNFLEGKKINRKVYSYSYQLLVTSYQLPVIVTVTITIIVTVTVVVITIIIIIPTNNFLGGKKKSSKKKSKKLEKKLG